MMGEVNKLSGDTKRLFSDFDLSLLARSENLGDIRAATSDS